MSEPLPPTVGTVDSATENAPRTVAPLARGTSIDRYIVLEYIGHGGMGIVYKAYDPDLDRTIAIKLVRADGRNPDQQQRLRARLIREAQALARLSHGNVVGVYDVGAFDDGVFVAMEHVDGVTLGTLLRQHTPPLDRIVALFVDAGRGLAAAHAVGIVHRDFKPENVIVARGGTARVLDFGLAHPAPDEIGDGDALRIGEAATGVTEAGTIVGTPGYMPPEQLDGGDVDARADQFSFCVALHEALFALRPAADPQEIPGRATTGDRVSPRMRAALRRGLAADRTQRHATMRDLLDELVPSPRRRRWIAAGAIAAATLAATAVVASQAAAQAHPCEGFETKLGGVWDAPRKAALHAALVRDGGEPGAASVERILDEYAAATVAMYGASCRATHVLGAQSTELLDLRTECLDRRLAELRELTDGLIAGARTSARHAVASAHGLSPVDDCANTTVLREPLPPKNRTLATMMRPEVARMRARLALGEFDDVARRAQALTAAAQLAGDRWLEASAVYLSARAAQGVGHRDVAEDQFYRAIALAETARASDVVIDGWTTLAWLVGEERRHPVEGLRLAAIAHAVLDRLGKNPRLEAPLEDHIGVLELDAGRLAEARTHLQHGLELREQTSGKDSEYAASLQHLALLEQASGDGEKALGMLREALRDAAAELGPGSPEVLEILGSVGAALHDLHRYDEAVALLEPAVPLAERTTGASSEIVASLLTNLGVARWKLGRLADARAALTRAAAITAANTPRATTLDLDLALVLVDAGELADARTHAERAVAGLEHELGADHPDVAMALDTLGTADLGTAHGADALAAFERALAIRTRAKANAADLAWTKFEIAKATLATTHDLPRARALAETARTELAAANDTESAGEVTAWLRDPKP